MESINFISDDLHLIKFRSTAFSGFQDYWTIIDKYGQIKQIPNLCKDYKSLSWYNFSAGSSKLLDSGTLIMLRGGKKKVLSIATDVMIEETEINLMEFSRTGDCSQVQKFDKKKYTDKLRK